MIYNLIRETAIRERCCRFLDLVLTESSLDSTILHKKAESSGYDIALLWDVNKSWFARWKSIIDFVGKRNFIAVSLCYADILMRKKIIYRRIFITSNIAKRICSVLELFFIMEVINLF